MDSMLAFIRGAIVQIVSKAYVQERRGGGRGGGRGGRKKRKKRRRKRSNEFHRYRPSVPVSFMKRQLMFEEDSSDSCVAFLQACACDVSNDQSTLVIQTGKGRE